MALRQIKKNAICVNEEPLMERYKYLDPDNVVISYDEFLKRDFPHEIDLFIVADTNSLPRVGSRVQTLVIGALAHGFCPLSYQSGPDMIEFVVEQLRLLRSPKTGRRYSTSLVTTVFLWN